MMMEEKTDCRVVLHTSARGRSQSVPMAYGIQYGVHGHSQSELRELWEMIKHS